MTQKGVATHTEEYVQVTAEFTVLVPVEQVDGVGDAQHYALGAIQDQITGADNLDAAFKGVKVTVK